MPFLDFWLDIGAFQASTEILNESEDGSGRTWFGIRVSFFYFFGFSIRLYTIHTPTKENEE